MILTIKICVVTYAICACTILAINEIKKIRKENKDNGIER